MGRGRAKAKQAKVARKLKYNTQDMDLDRLQRELTGGNEGSSYGDYSDYEDAYPEDDYSEYEDRWAEYVEGEDDADEEDDAQTR